MNDRFMSERLDGNGEMAVRIRGHDWAATPLGPIEAWPASLRTAVDLTLGSPVATILLWGPTHIQIYNDPWRTLMSGKHPAAFGQPTHACFPEIADIMAPLYERVQRGEAVILQDALLPINRDGAVKEAWWNVHYLPVRNGGNTVVGIFCTVIETTKAVMAERERTAAVAALHESEAKYRTLFTAIDEGLAVFDMIFDEGGKAVDFRYVETNDGFAKQTGRRPEPGQTMREVFPEAEDMWLDLYATVTRTGQAERFADFVAGLDRWYSVYVFPAGAPGQNRLAALFTDVTDRRRAEDALRESEELRRIALEGGRMGTWRLDLRDELIWGDAAFLELWGLPPSDGPHALSVFTDRMSSEGRTEIGAVVSRATAAGDAFDGQIEVMSGPGRGRWAQLRGRPERDRPWIVNGVSFDMTEQRLHDERLAADLADTLLLRDLAARLVTEDDVETIYDEIVSAAIGLAEADAGTLQIYDPKTHSLALLATRNFSRAIIERFRNVHASSRTGRGLALRTGRPAFVDFTEEVADPGCALLVGAGFQSAQAIPLVSRAGRLLGMLNTHWRQTGHRPSERQSRFLDLLARQAADLIERSQAGEALRESEERLRLALSISTVGVAFWSGDGCLTDMNDAFLRMTGFSRAEALRKSWNDLTPPDFRQRSAEFVEEVRDTGEGAPYEKQYFRKDGSHWWGLFTARKLGPGFVEFVLDISTRKHAEAALRDSEERFRALVTAGTYSIYRMSPDWRIMYQLDSANLTHTAEPIEDWASKYILDDDCPIVFAAIEQAIRTKSLFELEHRVRLADGRVGWVISRAVPLLDGQGEITEWFGAGTDITERREATERLRESEGRFQQFAASSADALWIRDAATFAMEYASPAMHSVYGVPPETMLGGVEHWTNLVLPEDRDGALRHLEQARGGEATIHEFRICRPPEGEERWIRNTDFPLRDGMGRVQRIGGIAEDVTDAKRATQRLEVLVNELQHRSRNLLGVVSAVADRTVKQGGPVEAFEERLQALSRALGLLSQNGSDTVEVGALVRAELAAHTEAASEQVEISGPEVRLRARQVQNFALALHELTTNAVKYGALKGSPGHLAVTWEAVLDRHGHRRLALSWSESGVAINPETITRRGCGTELIQEALAYAMQAQVDYILGSDGVRCRIEMPIS